MLLPGLIFNIPTPDFVKPPVPMMVPVSVVVLDAFAEEIILLLPVRINALASIIAAEVSNCAVPEVLSSVIVLSFNKLASVVKSKVAVPDEGVMFIAPPVAAVPNACEVEAVNLPAVIVVVPV